AQQVPVVIAQPGGNRARGAENDEFTERHERDGILCPAYVAALPGYLPLHPPHIASACGARPGRLGPHDRSWTENRTPTPGRPPRAAAAGGARPGRVGARDRRRTTRRPPTPGGPARKTRAAALAVIP